jgi:hypothetical protein
MLLKTEFGLKKSKAASDNPDMLIHILLNLTCYSNPNTSLTAFI